MTGQPIQTFAAINSGSSTLKFGLFTTGDVQQVLKGRIAGIGTKKCSFSVVNSTQHSVFCDPVDVETIEKAATFVIKWLKEHGQYEILAMGHRFVQGGLKFHEPVCLNDDIISELKKLENLAPLHLPDSLTIVNVFRKEYPGIEHVACFDTAFHRDMPFEARHYALPRSLWAEGLIRYGFHGLSCEYICHYLNQSDLDISEKKIIVAHLGSGSSLTAVRNGTSIETTMGFSPAGGMMMNSRPGDIDPGITAFLLNKGIHTQQLDELFNKQSGLKAIAESDHSVAQLQEEEGADPKAAQALSMYCYQAKKQIGSLVAVLGGLDLLIFTGGIGENAPAIRKQICAGLEFLGIELNEPMNERSEEIISELSSNTIVYVVPANEELIIASHVKKIAGLT